MYMFIKRRPISAPKLDPSSGHSNSRKCIDIETKTIMQQICTFTSRYVLKNVTRMQSKKSTKIQRDPKICKNSYFSIKKFLK